MTLLTDEDRQLARLADIAYEDNTDTRHSKAQYYGYHVDKELSDNYHTIYHKNDRAVVAFRGTKVTDPNDLSADYMIANMRMPADRIANGREKVAKAKGKYKDVLLTGHSLGGTVANEISKDTGHNAVIFNPGTNPLRKAARGRNVKIYRHRNDPISYGYSDEATSIGHWFDPMAVLAPAATAYSAHKIDNFF